MKRRPHLLAALLSLGMTAGIARGADPSARAPVDHAHQQQLLVLTARAVRELDARHTDAARTTLTEALAIDPTEPTNLYSLARLDALTGHPADAVDDLRRSVDGGFADFARLADEPDLQPLHGRPDYKAIADDPARQQRRAGERALADLRQLFGSGYLYDVDDQHRFVFATHTDRTALDALNRDLTAQANSQWQQLFEHHPTGYTRVVIASPADYARLRPSANVLGFYLPSHHMLIASGLGSVTTHEFTHALHLGDLEATGQDHPLWVTEGLAVLFERSTYKGDVLTPQPNERLYEVLILKRLGQMVRLDTLLRMPRGYFMVRPGICYAESGALMAFLNDQGLLRTFYDSYKAGYAADPTGITALELTTGHPLSMTERDFWQWLRTQQPPPLYTGDRSAWLGVDFDPATDGLAVTALAPRSPADSAGMKEGDVLVGLDGLEVRDRGTFAPLLAVHKPGETVTFNVRRGSDYLALPIVLGSQPPR